VFPPPRGDWADIWHPTAAGHAIIAGALAPVVDRALPAAGGP
jgi:hypothetical protein